MPDRLEKTPTAQRAHDIALSKGIGIGTGFQAMTDEQLHLSLEVNLHRLDAAKGHDKSAVYRDIGEIVVTQLRRMPVNEEER